MKRFLSVLLTVAMLISAVQFAAFAEDSVVAEGSCGDAVTWELTEDGILTISGSGAMEAYSCPWLEFPSSIRNVEFSDEITSIPESAFSYCSNLESIHLPAQLQEIPQRAFYSCKGLTEIMIPAGVTNIGYEAFIYCSNLTSITFLGDPPQFGRYAFSGVTATVYHDINNSNWPPSSSNRHYGSFTYATYGEPATGGVCGDDARWEYADGVLTITGTGAMYDMWYDEAPWLPFRSELHTVVIGEGITDIGYYAFFECAALTDVTLPSTLKTIRYAAFAECTGLKEIDIPEGVTEVGGGAYAFSGCTSLERISLPSTLERISTGCFRNCSSLKEIEIPEGIVSFGGEAFYGCSSLKTVVLPEGMTTINPGLFSNSGITEVNIPSTVEVIGDAFDNCVNLKEITIPASVTYIRQYTFADSISLEKVIFEGDAPELCDNIFRNVTATVWYPTDNATWTEEVMQQYGGTITWVAYGDNNGDGLVDERDTECISGTSRDVSWTLSDGVLRVYGSGRMDDYVAWKGYEELIREVIVEDGVTYVIGFTGCVNLSKVTLADSVTTLGFAAFYDCRSLETIDVPEGVTRIGERCFMGCTSLREVNIPGGNVRIENDVFSGCTSLKTLELPEGMTGLYMWALSGTSLEEIKLPSTLEGIGPGAFAHSQNLTYITIPASVTSMSRHVFQDCTALANVKFEGDAPEFPEPDGIFQNVTATVWYPADNATWTEEVMQQYGGTITWKAYYPGDVNADGEVNNKDATRLFQYLAGWNVETAFAALDVNGDGAVNNKDATRLFQHLAGWNVEIH